MSRPRPRRRLLAALTAAAALTVALVGATTTAAPPASAAACTGTSGVTVVVDFTALGGGVQTGCAPGDPTSGLAALTGAGFGYAFHPRFPGMVCRINALPNPCNGAPVTAYWSYWHAAHGGPWSYSTLGAGSYDPAPGDVEGRAFGAGSQPGITAP
ncbi:flagellar hook-length control protein FliK [Kitasatospora sp. NPDC088346]|uniref:flagellar hook-length control protein FliK n=1 Tax=Kitasatospora sp. NPDC088346 TaxID=3364073 RepID=UPI003818DDE2